MTPDKMKALIAEARSLTPEGRTMLTSHERMMHRLADAIESLLALVPEPASEDEREVLIDALESIPNASWDMAYEIGDLSEIVNGILAAGFTRRPLLTEEKVSAWVRENFAVSNGTQVWAEYMGSVEELTNIALALLTKGQD